MQSNNLLDDQVSENIQDYNSVYYSLRYEFIKPQINNLLFPVSTKLNVKGSFGNRSFEGSKNQQQIYDIEALKIFNLNSNNSFFVKIRSGAIFSDNYLENELLRFGGINSIRGFEENSLIASLYAVANTEYRYQLSPSIYLHSIIDVAYLENEIINLERKPFWGWIWFWNFNQSWTLKIELRKRQI